MKVYNIVEEYSKLKIIKFSLDILINYFYVKIILYNLIFINIYMFYYQILNYIIQLILCNQYIISYRMIMIFNDIQ